MKSIELAAVQERFADIVWENAPLTTAQLIDLCAKELNWKRTTTYTVLKKLCEGGLFKMENRMVTVLIPKEEYAALQSEHFVEKTFGGSLPAFLAAFGTRKQLSDSEVDELKKLIEGMRR